ncbi:hypothetical protein [Hymenobacter sediminicola]|uniref:Uncharacterized protein n=2 Tax=Hymenobacter TaxID=89966 RepID=A0A1M7GME9_9BACT|nr:hypothetical protein [Hymenobacter sediminicola]QNH61243.1 hypothetical protein H4317_13850 [Hymenobacter sediminicola]SHM17087.1 hypothetical protein SAMN02746009_04065 [Hymenobacter psychrotolerans DSM 18569]
MSIFGSDRPSGTLGGLISGLFGGRTAVNPTTGTYDTPARSGGSRKLLGGALLAAGAAYLYSRNKNRNASTPSFTGNK